MKKDSTNLLTKIFKQELKKNVKKLKGLLDSDPDEEFDNDLVRQ